MPVEWEGPGHGQNYLNPAFTWAIQQIVRGRSEYDDTNHIDRNKTLGEREKPPEHRGGVR